MTGNKRENILVEKFRKHFTFFLVIPLLIISYGCGKKGPEPVEKGKAGFETARIINRITSGIISPSGNISVRFTNPVGNIPSAELFSISPEIDGKTVKKDSQTILFKPSRKLPFRKSYKAIFHIEKFKQYSKMRPVSFTFETSGREVSMFTGDFELSPRMNPFYVVYKATILFTEDVEKTKIEEGIRLFYDKISIPLRVKEVTPQKKFSITSGEIRRGYSPKTYKLVISGKKLDLSGDIEKLIKLMPVSEFGVSKIVKFDQGETPGFEVIFSDILDKDQDIRGLIRTTPPKKISLKKIHKSIYISGDFEYGKSYRVLISGIKSKWGVKLKNDIEKDLLFEDKKPALSFTSSGVFLPSANKRTLTFKTINVSEVKLLVQRIFESNLNQFLQTESLESDKSRSKSFSYYEVKRVGVKVAEKTLKIGNVKNRWLIHSLDLNKILKPEDKGVYLIKLSFTRKAMLWSGLKKKSSYYYGREYYSNPNSWGYLYRHGSVYKPVIISDIGLTYKKGDSEHLVFATNIITSEAEKNVKIRLKSYQGQLIAEDETDGSGIALFKGIKEKVFIIEGEKDGQRSVIKPSEMRWNLSSFDIGGVAGDIKDTNAFIYTERGVYRPGDTINLSIIARNRENSFPDNLPVTLKLYNPKNQLIFTKINKKSKNGFYNFNFKTERSSMTGNWRAKLLIGGKTFYKTLKIETVVPNRLKVTVTPSKKELGKNDKILNYTIHSSYLFGSPAANLKAQSEIVIKNRLKIFPKYHGYTFSNEVIRFREFRKNLFSGTLDATGGKEIKWPLPDISGVPSALNIEITSKVFEKGGRYTQNKRFIPVEPYDLYIGLEKPAFRWNYSRVGKKITIPAIIVTRDGKAVSGRMLKYSIYRNSKYWWWEYDSVRNFRIKYKKDVNTQLVKEGTVISKNYPVPIDFSPQDSGEYFIEVSESVPGGHSAGFFFSSYYWGDTPQKDSSAGTLILKTDKNKYHPGEKARVSFMKPKKGTVFISIEKGSKIIMTKVYESGDKEIEKGISIDITENMLPNVYASVSIIQPHSETGNDRPLRTYGTIPILVEKRSTRHKIQIFCSNEFKTGKEFSVEIKTDDKKATRFTIAVVDEGLLDLTQFRTPDPWKFFFKKQRLGIATYDLFNHVIGANKGDIYRLFSVGGEMRTAKDEYRESQLGPKKARRFKPVSLFKGPLETDKNGYKKITFKMPDYIGAVRIMVVAADGNRYGKAEKIVPVKSDLMLLPTLPRAVGPGDTFDLPVTVFAMQDKVGKVNVSLKAKGALEVVSTRKKTLQFNNSGEKDIIFTLKAKYMQGVGNVTIFASSKKYKTKSITELDVKASSPRIYKTEKAIGSPGKKISMRIPNEGIQGTNRASLTISMRPKLDLDNRVEWLIRYPYGCIEQTVSSAFPQLYLKEFIRSDNYRADEIDNNINKAISRITKFSLISGGLSYWPGGKTVSLWGTNYAAHFLVEAKRRGYSVPSGLYSGILRFLKQRSRVTSDNIMVRIHRLYILSIAGEPMIGPMNLIYENDLKTLKNINRWMLAAAYFNAGKKEMRDKILKGSSTTVNEYKKSGITFGSRLRDRGIILDILTQFQDWNKADIIFDMITEEISSDNWYSTQSLGYSLLALGKYISLNPDEFRKGKSPITGFVKFPDGRKKSFNFTGNPKRFPIKSGFGRNVEIFISGKTVLKKVHASMNWNGVPLISDESDLKKNLEIKIDWFTEKGEKIDPSVLKQGSSLWCVIKVSPGIYSRNLIKNVALVQVLPAGWEIENLRITGEQIPGWIKKNRSLFNESYQDIRDDRVMWFFDLPGYSSGYDFVVKLNCITAGTFTLPSTIAEAMYTDMYRARRKGKEVRVIK